MTVEQFLVRLKDIVNNSNSFSENLNKEEHTFCEWIDIYIHWMEWEDKEECEHYY